MSDLELKSDAAGNGAGEWRAPLNRLEHIVIRVHDLGAAVSWYQGALDLALIGRDDSRALLGCGGDDRVDLVLEQGGTGIAAFAFGVPSATALETVERRFAEKGVDTRSIDSGIPGVDTTLEVVSPSGVKLRVAASDAGPTGVAAPSRPGGVAPIDVDHVTLLSPDVRGYVGWLGEILGFAVSDAFTLPDGSDGWLVAWAHITPQHHDVAVIASPPGDATLHHAAFLAEDLNHMGEIAERVCSMGARDRCEWGPGKHGGLGANYYLYFKDPSGNRIEICSNMDSTPFDEVLVYDGSEFAEFASIWNYLPPPPDFTEGT